MAVKRFLIILFIGFLTFSAPVLLLAEGDDEVMEEPEVVVTATRTPIEESQAPGTVQVVTKEEIEQSPATQTQDLAEFLSLWLGAQVNSNGTPGGVSSLSLRGGGSEQILVMLNGIPLINPQNGMASLSFIPVHMAKRVEVIEGPLSSLYGEGAMGGVINIITGGEPGGRFLQGAGSYGSLNTSLSYQWENAGLGFGRSQSDGYRANSDYDGNWGYGFYRFRVEDWDLDFGFYCYDDDKGIPGPDYAPSLTARGSDGQTTLYGTARLTTENHDLLFRLYSVRMSSFFRDGASLGDHKSYRLGLEAQSSWSPNTAVTLTTVGKWEYTGVDSNVIGKKDGSGGNLAVQLEWTPDDKIRLYAGDLFNRQSIYGSNHSPRLGLVYRLRPDTVAKASFSRAFRAPTYNELYWPADAWSHGNPDLKPETSDTFELGLEHYFQERLAAKLSFYRTMATNLIEWQPEDNGDGDPWNDPWSPQNYGKVRMEGADLSLAWRPADPWKLCAQIHLLNADEFNPATGDYDLKLTTRTPASGTLGLVYQGKKFEGSWFTRYFQGHGNVGSSAVSDLGLAYRLTEESQLKLGVQNVFDRDYVFNAGYPMPGLNYQLEFVMSF